MHRASDGFEVLIDARESAPHEASRDMYLDETGERVARASPDGPKAAAIPGTPAALDWIAKRYGKLALEQSLAPAVRLARDGFEAGSRFLSAARYSEKRLLDSAAAIFLKNGAAPEPGFVIRQTDLARTLRRLATEGRDGFYTGAVANDLVQAVREAGGIWTGDDLAGYQVIERAPLKLRYRGLTITAPPLPSSAGITLAQCLNILELFPIAAMSETERAHHVIEALRRGFQDRTRYLGDVGDAPIARLTSKSYARERASDISTDRATASASLDAPDEGGHTTHFSIVDAEGNRVAATLTINTIFGSGFIAGETGVLLNNEMNDFAIRAGKSNVHRLVTREPNEIAPGKRPLSSMAPAFVEDAKGVLVIGTAGGSRIISQILLAILDFARGLDVHRIVAGARYHHQYLPDHVDIEPESFSEDWRHALARKGHTPRVGGRRWGNMQAVYVDRTGRIEAASDPRGRSEIGF